MSSQPIIRPKIRKAKVASSLSSSNNNAIDDGTEDVRMRMDGWMGLNASSKEKADVKTAAASSSVVVSAVSLEPQLQSRKETPTDAAAGAGHTTSILKKNPKYSITNTVRAASQPFPQATTTIQATIGGHEEEEISDDAFVSKSTAPVVCKEFVVERDPQQHPPKRKTKTRPPASSAPPNAHMQVEGYAPSIMLPTQQNLTTASFVTPRGDKAQTPEPPLDADPFNISPSGSSFAFPKEVHNNQVTTKDNRPSDDGTAALPDKEQDTEEDLILNSLEDLLRAAGQPMPDNPTKIDSNTQMLETDLQFSVMTQNQYTDKLAQLKREHQEDQQAQMNMFLGKDNIFGDDDESREENDEESDNEEDDDELLEFLMQQQPEGSEYDNDEENSLEPEARAFRKLWDALSDWVTPEAVQFITSLEEAAAANDKASNDAQQHYQVTPQVDRSDIGASRCAGLMAMVKLYLPSILNELEQPPDQQRMAEQRLGGLLRTFSYSREAPKLEVKLWKAMTCIFLAMVLVETRSSDQTIMPPSVLAVGMTAEEYTYLSRKAVQTFVPMVV